MDTADRERLIEAYYEAVDAADIDRFASLFTDEATHFRPGQGTLEGLSAIQRFFRDDWRSTRTDHEIEYLLHDSALTVARLHVSGNFDGEPFEGRFLAEFEFDDGAIDAYRLYRGYQR